MLGEPNFVARYRLKGSRSKGAECWWLTERRAPWACAVRRTFGAGIFVVLALTTKSRSGLHIFWWGYTRTLGVLVMNEGSDRKQAVISYPAEIPRLLKMSESEFARELRFLAAAKLVELGKLYSRKAARLAEMSRVASLHELQMQRQGGWGKDALGSLRALA